MNLYNYKYRLIFALGILISLFLYACNEFKTNDLERLDLKGKIQSIQEISYQAIEKEGQIIAGKRSKPSWKKDTKQIFNRNGELIQEIVYATNGGIRLKSKLKANFKEKTILETSFDAQDVKLYTQISKLNQKDEIVEKIRYDLEQNVLAKYEYEYNDKGDLVTELQFLDNDDKPSVKTLYEYDEHGNKVKEFMYNPLGKLIAKWISTYNDANLLIEEKYYFSDGSLSAIENYEYQIDENGNWIQQIVKSNDKPVYFVVRNIEYY